MALAPHDFTALAPHDYTAPAPHDCTAPAPPPRARYANDSEFKFGICARSPKNSKFLVPVDGSQQNFERSSPAGTHRTFFWIHFQNPVSPTSISQPFAPFLSLHPYPTHDVHAPSPPRLVVPVKLTPHTHNHSTISTYGFPPRAPGRQSRDSTRALTRGPSAPAAAHSTASHRACHQPHVAGT